MDFLRRTLPRALVYLGGGMAVAFSVLALLSFRDPISGAMLLLSGLVAGSLVAASGIALAYLGDIARSSRATRQDLRAQVNILSQIRDLAE